MSQFERLSGLIAAPFTPMKGDGSVNLDAIGPYADFLVSQGVAGAFICGTTGEGFSLTVKERQKVAETWVEASGGRLKIIVHVGHNCQADAVTLAGHAQRCGADAVASIAPTFYKPCCVDDLVDFFVPVAAAAPQIPFYYYNMPSMSGVSLPADKFLELGGKKIHTLQGLKFTHNDLMEMNRCLHLEGCRFEVLHGFDEILICGLALGAKAGVGSTYNYAGKIYGALMDAFESGDIAKARELQLYSVDIVGIIVKYGGGVRGGKAIMNLLGIECGECRLPINRFSADEYRNLKADLEAIDFFNRIK